MPTYEYECRSCGAGFDVFQSMSEDPLKVCPSCGKDVRRKINGGTGIIFKGSGFYKNDNRKPGSSDGESSRSSSSRDSGSKEGSAAKSDSKAAAPAPAGSASSSNSSSSSSDAPKKEST